MATVMFTSGKTAVRYFSTEIDIGVEMQQQCSPSLSVLATRPLCTASFLRTKSSALAIWVTWCRAYTQVTTNQLRLAVNGPTT